MSISPLNPLGSVGKAVATTPVERVPSGTVPAQAAAARVPAPSASAAGAQAVAASVTAREADLPPINQDRVALIRDAVQSGKYPIMPAKIADALIAAGMLLSVGDKGA